MYKLQNGSQIVRIVGSAYIPPDDNNVDYQYYLEWLDNGGVLELSTTSNILRYSEG